MKLPEYIIDKEKTESINDINHTIQNEFGENEI